MISRQFTLIISFYFVVLINKNYLFAQEYPSKTENNSMDLGYFRIYLTF